MYIVLFAKQIFWHIVSFINHDATPGAPRDGGPSDFLGSEILAKSDFFGSMKDARVFLGS